MKTLIYAAPAVKGLISAVHNAWEMSPKRHQNVISCSDYTVKYIIYICMLNPSTAGAAYIRVFIFY